VKRSFAWPARVLVKAAAIAMAVGIAAPDGIAQSPKTPSLFKASPKQREEPIRVTSVTLEVRDKEKKATFSGDVRVVQGETDLRCSELVIFYDGGDQAVNVVAAAPTSDRGNQRIRRMEARGSVVMTQKDQRAVGDHADFDVQKNTMVLTGNVIVMRGEDVLRGKRLSVNMNTGVYTMESDGDRVEMLINSKGMQSPQGMTPGRPKRIN
jgi:lipopolysaccharide export system protein LptA